MTVASDLAARVVALTAADLPARAIEIATRAIQDTVAVTLAGCDDPAVGAVARLPGVGDGPCRLLGRRTRTDALNAALINGVAAHALDFDDVNATMGGHPSAPILPALFALADQNDCGGLDFLLAFVAGVETETRLAHTVNFHHYEKGWHPTATLGVFGAAAACAKLLRLDQAQTTTALAICGSLASGVKSNFGAMTKPLHIGQCARNGLMAALLARDGFTAKANALEGKQGFFDVYNGAGNYDLAKLAGQWTDPLNIVTPGIGVKLYPCCDSTHAAIDIAFALRKEHRVSPDDIAEARVELHPLRLIHVDRPAPRTPTDAKFSVTYCLARALIDGAIVMAHFEPAAFNEPKARELMRRVTAKAFGPPLPQAEGHYTTEVAITLKSGKTITLRREQPYGRAPEDELPADLFRAKFDGCTTSVLGAAGSLRLWNAIAGVKSAPSVRTITAFAQPAATVDQAAQ